MKHDILGEVERCDGQP